MSLEKEPPRVLREAGERYGQTRRTPTTAPRKRGGLVVIGFVAGPNIAAALSDVAVRRKAPLNRFRIIRYLGSFDRSRICTYHPAMNDLTPSRKRNEADIALLKRELEKGLASGVSKRSPEQVRAAFRKARAAA